MSRYQSPRDDWPSRSEAETELAEREDIRNPLPDWIRSPLHATVDGFRNEGTIRCDDHPTWSTSGPRRIIVPCAFEHAWIVHAGNAPRPSPDPWAEAIPSDHVHVVPF